MTQKEVYKEIRQTLGHVPSFFDDIPKSQLESYWRIFYRKAIVKVKL